MGESEAALSVGRRAAAGGLAALATATAPTGRAATPWSVAPARPDILLLLADDWSWQPEDRKDRFDLRLPTFSRLRRESASLPNAIFASPSCTARRTPRRLV